MGKEGLLRNDRKIGPGPAKIGKKGQEPQLPLEKVLGGLGCWSLQTMEGEPQAWM